VISDPGKKRRMVEVDLDVYENRLREHDPAVCPCTLMRRCYR
jgi:hypothetical protein